MKAVVVIPARHASERFPGKPLAPIDGVPMILRVLRNAKQARLVADVVVATDDSRIASIVEADGGHVKMITTECRSGTDRVAAAAAGEDWDIVVNLQGDEPLMRAEVIDQVIACACDEGADVVTAILPLTNTADFQNPNVVKVVRSADHHALYFSRSAIPFRRTDAPVTIYKHLGIYCYRREFLFRFCAMPPSSLERAESLEQLRILEAGHRIRLVETSFDSIGVDTPSDVTAVEAVLTR